MLVRFPAENTYLYRKKETMDRVFHARIATAQYLALLLFAFVLVYCLWVKYIGIALLWAILLLRFIEKVIHTTYTVTTDGRLLLDYGRFSRGREIPLSDITGVERMSSMRVGRFCAVRYVLVRYGQGKTVSLLPQNEESFVRTLEARMGQGGGTAGGGC